MSYTPGRPLTWAALYIALGLSGVAGIINQVVWQRALKIFLGGSETLSAMTVVLVFMLGLGLGAALGGRLSARLGHPLRALAGVEALLALLNLGVAWVLGLDISESVYAVQRLAVGVGVPLRAVYVVASTLLLLPPTMLMGATLPLASETAQRQLGANDRALVPTLFFTNTIGAALGAWAASAWLLPLWGQRSTLSVAVALNLTAAVVLGIAASGLVTAAPRRLETQPVQLRPELWVGGLLGFLSLGYEMVLFRILALAHEPLPMTFAVGLCAYLLSWSVGMFLSTRLTIPIWLTALLTAVATAATPWLYAQDRFWWELDPTVATSLYCLPPLGFGLLYGAFVTAMADDWGRDVGAYAAFNTVGSALGILAFTLLGHDMPQNWPVAIITTGLVALALHERHPRMGLSLGVVGMTLLAAVGLQVPYTEAHGLKTYWGRDGVVEINQESGEVYIDGFWHTKLSDGTDHIGRPYTWLMAVGAALAHPGEPARALVVGAGVGVSSVSLEGIEGVHVDGYEINDTLRRVLEDHPDQTLRVLERERIDWIWQDARSGLALNEQRYDIILSAPLLLRQAGSSLLLSREYLRLVKSRLQPGGVLAIYSHEGPGAQSWLVQRTLAELFEHRIRWYDSTVTIVSDEPIQLTEDEFRHRLERPGRLYEEMRSFDLELKQDGTPSGLYAWYDGDDSSLQIADQAITDDHPLVEYPELATQIVDPLPIRLLPR